MAHIMVVEDDEDISDLLCSDLVRAGHEVEPVGNGLDALSRLENRTPDLVLLDITLPGWTGWELCEEVAKRDKLADLPVVIFTGRGAREDFDQARQYPNFAGFFVKPYTTNDVVRHVAKVLAERVA